VKLTKIKRPAGAGHFVVEALMEDEFGVWLYVPTGSAWEAPHDTGKLPFDVLTLIQPDRHWVTWWVDDPADRRLEIDVCLPPQREPEGWSYIDLELDPVRHEDGRIEILDRDEFDVACREGWIESEDAETALAAATAMELALRSRQEPWGDEGWRRLAAARDQRSDREFR
jgi:hypothetical protein